MQNIAAAALLASYDYAIVPFQPVPVQTLHWCVLKMRMCFEHAVNCAIPPVALHRRCICMALHCVFVYFHSYLF